MGTFSARLVHFGGNSSGTDELPWQNLIQKLNIYISDSSGMDK